MVDSSIMILARQVTKDYRAALDAAAPGQGEAEQSGWHEKHLKTLAHQA